MLCTRSQNDTTRRTIRWSATRRTARLTHDGAKNTQMRYGWTRWRIAVAVWFTLLAAALGAMVYPVTYGALRFFIVAVCPLLWLSSAVLMWKRKSLAAIILLAGVLGAAFVSLPGHQPSALRLRDAYTKCLQRYEGTPYVWGGENRWGIDCSGLVREAMIDANLTTGLRTLNPKPIRTAFMMWWDDCSAKALRDEYRRFTIRLFEAKNINTIIGSSLSPGDMAVTADGGHVLAYLGSNTWIEADPGVREGDQSCHPVKERVVHGPGPGGAMESTEGGSEPSYPWHRRCRALA